MAADGLVNRGNTYKEIGRVNEAIQDYMLAITIRPNMAEAHANLASSYKDRFIVQFASFKQLMVLSRAFCLCPVCSFEMLSFNLLQWQCGGSYKKLQTSFDATS